MVETRRAVRQSGRFSPYSPPERINGSSPRTFQSPLSAVINNGSNDSPLSDDPSLPPPVNNIIKRRRRLTSHEASLLQQVFEACPRPTAAVRDKLADRLGMSKRCIQIWFQNRRAKQKRDLQDARQPPLLFKATKEAGEQGEYDLNSDSLDSLLSGLPAHSVSSASSSVPSSHFSEEIISPHSIFGEEGGYDIDFSSIMPPPAPPNSDSQTTHQDPWLNQMTSDDEMGSYELVMPSIVDADILAANLAALESGSSLDSDMATVDPIDLFSASISII